MKTLSEKKLSELTKIYNSFVTYSGKYAKEFLKELDKQKDKLSNEEYERILLLYKQSLFEVLKSMSISSSIFVHFNEDDDFFSLEDFPKYDGSI